MELTRAEVPDRIACGMPQHAGLPKNASGIWDEHINYFSIVAQPRRNLEVHESSKESRMRLPEGGAGAEAMSKDVRPGLPVIVLLAVVGFAMPGRTGRKSWQRRGAGSRVSQADVSRPQREIKGGVETTWAGADAKRPDQIPAEGWWAVLKRAAAGFSEDRLMTEAAAVTFYTLLAIFPAIAALVSLYGLIADPATVNDHLASLSSVVPSGGMNLITAQIKSLTANPSSALGFGAIFGFATSLWSANQGIKAMFDAMNVVYHEKEKRSYLRFTAVSLLFTFGAVVFVALAMASVAVVPLVLDALGLHDATAFLIAAARWPVLMIILTFILASIYRFGPSRERARWEWVTWGSALAYCDLADCLSSFLILPS